MQAQTSRKWRADDPRRLRMAETRAAILRAARPIMLRDGLGGTTLDRVAAEGGIAKMTLYRHFPSKEALFEGLVTATCESMREGLENTPTADTDEPIANRLADELRAFTSALIEPDGLALYRLIVADGWRFPELSRVFDRSGMRVIRRRIAELLETGGAPGDQARRIAGEVVALALGDAYQRALLGIAEAGDGEAFSRQIGAAVQYGLSRPA
jgi:TetR/AcrR family transcriptional regulator, mexJK operon transcriptional repressor